MHVYVLRIARCNHLAAVGYLKRQPYIQPRSFASACHLGLSGPQLLDIFVRYRLNLDQVLSIVQMALNAVTRKSLEDRRDRTA